MTGARPSSQYDGMDMERASRPESAVTTERRGVLLQFRRRGIDSRFDARLNLEWDRLLELAAEASGRRDATCLYAILDRLAELRSLIGPDWS
jgi:hypothetical protein